MHPTPTRAAANLRAGLLISTAMLAYLSGDANALVLLPDVVRLAIRVLAVGATAWLAYLDPSAAQIAAANYAANSLDAVRTVVAGITGRGAAPVSDASAEGGKTNG